MEAAIANNLLAEQYVCVIHTHLQTYREMHKHKCRQGRAEERTISLMQTISYTYTHA